MIYIYIKKNITHTFPIHHKTKTKHHRQFSTQHNNLKKNKKIKINKIK